MFPFLLISSSSSGWSETWEKTTSWRLLFGFWMFTAKIICKSSEKSWLRITLMISNPFIVKINSLPIGEWQCPKESESLHSSHDKNYSLCRCITDFSNTAMRVGVSCRHQIVISSEHHFLDMVLSTTNCCVRGFDFDCSIKSKSHQKYYQNAQHF